MLLTRCFYTQALHELKRFPLPSDTAAALVTGLGLAVGCKKSRPVQFAYSEW